MTGLFVIGRIGGQDIAFDATCVEAVVDIAMVVPVPLAAGHVVGLAAIRSQVITVLDGSIATGGRGLPPTGRAVVAAINGHRYAIRVDAVDDVVSGTRHEASNAVPLGEQWRGLTSGIIDLGAGFAVVIDPARLVAVPASAIAA